MYTHQQHNILDSLTPEEFEKHAIIQPPENSMFIDNDKKSTRLVVDSMFRDHSQYPNPNDYYFVFDDDINDVCSAKLISVDIPFSTYIINKYFNKLWMTVNNGPEVIINLTQGNYNTQTLGDMIATKLQETFPTANFEVTYSPLLDSYTFSANTSFSIHFLKKNNSLDTLLGFRKENYTSIDNIIKAPFRCNFHYNNYIVMCIDSFDMNKSNNKPLNKSFAVITNKDTVINISDSYEIIKNFNPAIPRLPKIHITFYDRYGNLYDFQNMDHRFEILFQSFKQRRKYQNIFGIKSK